MNDNLALFGTPLGFEPGLRHASEQAPSALALAKVVTLQTHGKDEYKRTLADVLLADGTNVNHTLVKDG